MSKQRELRILNIAAMILYRYCGDISIIEPSTSFVDMIVRDNTSGKEFGVNVKSSSFLRNKSYDDYVSKLSGILGEPSLLYKPILLMLVNEQQESAQIGYQVKWFHGEAHIYRTVKVQSANEKNLTQIIEKIREEVSANGLRGCGVKLIEQ